MQILGLSRFMPNLGDLWWKVMIQNIFKIRFFFKMITFLKDPRGSFWQNVIYWLIFNRNRLLYRIQEGRPSRSSSPSRWALARRGQGCAVARSGTWASTPSSCEYSWTVRPSCWSRSRPLPRPCRIQPDLREKDGTVTFPFTLEQFTTSLINWSLLINYSSLIN